MPRVLEQIRHAALEIPALPRAIDIREAESDRRDAARAHEHLGLGLEPAVVRHGSRRSGLRGALRGLAVDRPARRDVHERARAEHLGEVEHIPRAVDDHPPVERLLLHRLDDLRLRGEVHDRIGACAAERVRERVRIRDIRDP